MAEPVRTTVSSATVSPLHEETAESLLLAQSQIRKFMNSKVN